VVTYEANPWDALGDGTRRAIFERLVIRPHAVGELADDLPVSRPAVSQHLRVLKDAGLVSDRAEGTRRVYAINPAGLDALRADLDRFWTHALDAFKTAAERPSRTEREKRKEKKKP
jgi:DNA-binding transcriptional ArsR family regulator